MDASDDDAHAAPLIVHVDGVARHVPAGSTLAQLLDALGHAPHDVATALNGRFVPRAERARQALQPHDAILLFRPIVGG